jgi:hypothetical protein
MTPLNENAKVFAVADELPELHHNTVEGLSLPGEARARRPCFSTTRASTRVSLFATT